MSKKIEEITDKIEANKEVLSTMPKNNIKNMDIYQRTNLPHIRSC